MNYLVHFIMLDEYNPTDLTTYERPRHDHDSEVDMYWFATDQSNFSRTTVLGDAYCLNSSNNVCTQFRVRFNEDTLIPASEAQKWHTTCHEIAHTLGSDDGDTRTTGCFPQSAYSLGRDLTTHEVGHLNARY